MHLSSCFPVFGLLLHFFLTCYSENFLSVCDGRFLEGRVCLGTLVQSMYGEYFVQWSPTLDRADGALPVSVPQGSQSSISLILSLPHPSKPDSRDFLCGPVVKNLPSKAGDAGLIPGTKLRSYMPWGNQAHILQPEKSLCAAMKTQCSQNKLKNKTKLIQILPPAPSPPCSLSSVSSSQGQSAPTPAIHSSHHLDCLFNN